jgi:hypothetical protein
MEEFFGKTSNGPATKTYGTIGDVAESVDGGAVSAGTGAGLEAVIVFLGFGNSTLYTAHAAKNAPMYVPITPARTQLLDNMVWFSLQTSLSDRLLACSISYVIRSTA